MRDAVIRTWAKEGFRLEIIDLDLVDRYGKALVTYRLTHAEKTVFDNGWDFHCSPLNDKTDDGTVAAILSFCSLQPGDTDSEYFDDYTPQQLAWCRLHGEELGSLAMEMEEAYYAGRREPIGGPS